MMETPAFIAFRLLWDRKFLNGTAVAGVMFGVFSLIGVSGIDWQNFREILVEDNPAREFELRRIVDAILRDVAVSHEVAQAAAELGPLGIEGSDGQQIGQVKSLDDRECVLRAHGLIQRRRAEPLIRAAATGPGALSGRVEA